MSGGELPASDSSPTGGSASFPNRSHAGERHLGREDAVRIGRQRLAAGQQYESETVNLITINFNLRNDSPETRTGHHNGHHRCGGYRPVEIKASQQGKA